ncbi:MAG TPA: sigma-70 family RNA polymerase sigma factor [Solirubrobacteraceae bacterium]|jgi:RNA polymerase sigma factor (sigma-70 family)|nr:sigma-70 family RNA polymerase sigma factor [Solirubrobacteraceae bacterium]
MRDRLSSDLRQFEQYARHLARRFPFRGSGGDEQDVAQEAMIAAWSAVETFNGRGRLEGFVRERMYLRVIDYVRMRSHIGQRRAERETLPLEAWDAQGGDTTVETVLARERLDIAARVIGRLTPRQRACLHGRMNGLSPAEIDPAKHPGTVDANAAKARDRVRLALASIAGD